MFYFCPVPYKYENFWSGDSVSSGWHECSARCVYTGHVKFDLEELHVEELGWSVITGQTLAAVCVLVLLRPNEIMKPDHTMTQDWLNLNVFTSPQWDDANVLRQDY